MEEISDFWNNANTPTLAGLPKLLIKVACRGLEIASTVKVSRGGGNKFYHPNAENVHIYASMPGNAIYDSRGVGKGSYFVETLVRILRNEKWRKEDLYSIILRMRRGIGKATFAREWVHFESANSKKIFFDKSKEKEGNITDV